MSLSFLSFWKDNSRLKREIKMIKETFRYIEYSDEKKFIKTKDGN